MWGHAIIVFLTKLSRLCQHSVTALSPHCHHIAITSPPNCHHIAITSPTHRRHIAATSPPHRRHIAATSPPHRRHIAATLPPHCRHLHCRRIADLIAAALPPCAATCAATLPPSCRHIAATLPPRCRHIAATLPPPRRHIAATSPPQLPQDLISANKVLFWPNRTLLAEIRSCGSCGGEVAAMWRQCGGNVAAMWRQCGGDVAAMWRQCGGDVVAMWWQCDDHTTTTFFTILTMKGQWHDDGNILQFEISSWSYHHVAVTKKVTRQHEIHGSSHLQAKRNPSQSATFHQRPKIVPTHRQIKTCCFDDDTALLAVLLQGCRHAAALNDWCDLKWPLCPSNAVIEWALIRFKNQARVTLGRCKSALCMCSKKEKRSDVKWVFVSGAGSIQLELCSINGLETTAVCFWQRMNSHC